MPPTGERGGVLVTGASSGIGRAASAELAGAGYRVFATVRTAQAAGELRRALGDAVVPLLLDVRDQEAVAAAAEAVAAAAGPRGLTALINNAGAAVAGPWLHLDSAAASRPFQVNVLGTLRVIQAFLPLLRPRGATPGRLINISSIAGRVAIPFMGPYAASKHALEALSASLRGELAPDGIRVVVIAPGMVATPIWHKPEALRADGYAETDYAKAITDARDRVLARGQRGIPPERVARLVRRVIECRQPRARYAIGPPGPLARAALALLPARAADRAIAWWVGGRSEP